MKILKRIIGFILICIISCGVLISCEAEKEKKLPEYIYNKNGESIGYIRNDFIFSFDRIAVAEYDREKRIFFNRQGYVGEIYKDKYLIYNEESKYKNIGPQIMSVKPIPLFRMKQASIQPITNKPKFRNILIINGRIYIE
ncbi:MAG: hypothetical protein E7353_08430 [Clostridiales bacterium]|nr:hypothetical protein [Clostridiales bacterium]